MAGLLVAIALNSPRLRALRFYRLLIVLPYAMPSFAMLLVWRDMFNTDFGLINNLTGQTINWFGNVWTARFAVLLVQFWLGYPYMFLVCLGRAPVDPGGHDRGRRGRRRQAVPGIQGGGLPAAPGRGRAAPDRVVRVQLQQLQRRSS